MITEEFKKKLKDNKELLLKQLIDTHIDKRRPWDIFKLSKFKLNENSAQNNNCALATINYLDTLNINFSGQTELVVTATGEKLYEPSKMINAIFEELFPKKNNFFNIKYNKKSIDAAMTNINKICKRLEYHVEKLTNNQPYENNDEDEKNELIEYKNILSYLFDISTIRKNYSSSSSCDDITIPGFEMVTSEEIERTLNTIKEDKSPGWDGISTKVLKILHKNKPNVLTTIFNKCFQYGCFPIIWKVAVLKLLKKITKYHKLKLTIIDRFVFCQTLVNV